MGQITAKGYEIWSNWFPLEKKKSKKSRIAGDIHLSVQQIPPEVTPQEKMAADRVLASVDHIPMYTYLLKGAFSFSFSFILFSLFFLLSFSLFLPFFLFLQFIQRLTM